MGAYAALVSLMNTTDHIQDHPQLSSSFNDRQIHFLREKASFFLDFIETYNFHGGSREAAQDLENKIASAAHAAEEAIESHVVDQIHANYTQENLDFLLDLHKIAAGMDSIKDEVMKAAEESGRNDRQPEYFVLPAAKSARSTTTGETIMVGFDHYSDELMDELIGYQSSRQIISIVGMGGIGKTTLARNTFENPVITGHFHVRAWVSVSQDYNVRQILLEALSHLKDLTNEVDGKNVDEINESELGVKLYKSLYGRRYLIILDDMWRIEAWDKIKFFFPHNGNGSRIILTTRQSDVAIHCGSSRIVMNLLEENECWDLFCIRVFGDEDRPLELEQTGKEIVKLCRGLPLSITVVGGLLQKSAKTLKNWQNVLENLKSILGSGEGDQCLKVLYSSYTHLPAHLKPCFLYMGTFDEDCEIPVSKMVKHWVAEGFVKPNGTRVLEEIAEDYIKDLVDRNLILIGKSRGNGKIRSCCIHDLIRDLCISIAKGEKFSLAGRVMYASEHSIEAILQNRNIRFITYNPLNISTFPLPSSIYLIWNLQSLVFKGRCSTIYAPTEIWTMPQLRHVECNSLHLPDPPGGDQGDEVCVLRNFQTLGKVLNFKWSEEVCKRIPNVKKLHLIYDDTLNGYNDDLCLIHLKNLALLHRLESVRVTFPFCISRYPVDLLSKKLALPSKLNKLCLTNCSLTREDVAMIGSLLHLQVLKLKHNSLLGGEWSCVNGEFSRLKFLRIESCDVVHWAADSSAFRVLEKLIVEDVWQLKEIPPRMGDINTLELMYVHHCSESAAISALEIKKEQESFGNDMLRIQVNISFASTVSFLERVKAGTLPFGCIQVRPF